MCAYIISEISNFIIVYISVYACLYTHISSDVGSTRRVHLICIRHRWNHKTTRDVCTGNYVHFLCLSPLEKPNIHLHPSSISNLRSICILYIIMCMNNLYSPTCVNLNINRAGGGGGDRLVIELRKLITNFRK